MYRTENYIQYPVKVSQSCLTLCNPMDYISPWNSPAQNTGVGSLSLLQGIFSTQGLNPGLQRCRRVFYQLSHKGSPRIPEWVAYPFIALCPVTNYNRKEYKKECVYTYTRTYILLNHFAVQQRLT